MLSAPRLSSALSPLAAQRLLVAGATRVARVAAAVAVMVSGVATGAQARGRAASRPFALAPGLCLPAAQARSLRLLPGDALVVREGRIWLTREGDRRDHFLQPGTSWVATQREVVVIEGLGEAPSRYEVERAKR
ncbi:DUF2917 domain-containing protein [Aquabacterium sp.]|uniref:DUF2917 domain-containing protein n=1 Tax=Aquabacterium sp. TaxID=1872578 RepID=UPI0025BA7739|nr:DUF2917 domain-containing protein [Aquabacterium sp.]